MEQEQVLIDRVVEIMERNRNAEYPIRKIIWIPPKSAMEDAKGSFLVLYDDFRQFPIAFDCYSNLS